MSDDESIAERAYHEILTGVWLVFIGGVGAAVMMLVGRSLIANLFSPAVYGAFGIGFTVLTFSAIFYRGLGSGVARQMSYALEDEDDPRDRIRGYVSWSLLLSFSSSLIVSATVSLYAGPIAELVFNQPSYEPAIRYMILGLPALSLLEIFSNVIRGYGESLGRVLFEDIMRTFLFPIVASVFAGFLTNDPVAAYISYPAALCVTAAWNAWYVFAYRDIPWSFSYTALRQTFDDAVDLMQFSLPLMLSFFLLVVMTRSDVFLLGILATPTEVGFYEVVRPILRVPLVVWSAMIWLYTPMVSAYTADNNKQGMRRLYIAMTKWFTLFTYPLFITAAFFPETIVNAVFGPTFTPAAPALRIVAIGMFIGTLMGPTGATMTGVGKTRSLMWANSIGTVANVGFNILLIPTFGIVGAAAGTVVAESGRNLARLYVLDDYGEIHALRAELYLPLGVTSAALLLIHRTMVMLAPPSVLLAAVFLFTSFTVYASSYYLTSSLNDDDRAMLALLRNRLMRAIQRE